MYMLRMLAQVDDPEKKPGAVAGGKRAKARKDQPPPMSIGELQQSLFQKARAQAKLERDRHLEMLRSKGIHVPTAEEREREDAEIEDMVARAKREAEEIMAREREAAKQDRKANKAAGEDDPLGWDDSDESGDEYVEEEEEEPAELELSGSDEEGGDDMDVDEEEEEEESAGLLIDDAADSADESEGGDAEEIAVDKDSDEEGVSTAKQSTRRRQRKPAAILSDDEDEGEQPPRIVEATPRPKANFFKSPRAPSTGSPSVPTSVLRSATKTFIPGLPVAGAAGLGLTQIFAGTMDDSQMGSAPGFGSPSQPRPTFDPSDLPDSNFSQIAEEISPDIIMDSQPTQGQDTQGVQFNFAPSQALGFDTLLRGSQQDASQMSLIEPTQDGGYQDFSPLVRRFVEAPASTVETVKLPESQGDPGDNQSPLVKRTGRLRRRAELVATTVASGSEADVEGAMDADQTDEFGFGTVKPAVKPSAFSVMQEAAVKKKKAAEFDKKKSKAREMVQEQAEESEDEYAGLGGVDGEDSDDDDAQSVKEMIDDETKHDETDERKIAAFHA